ncbi:MAG: tetratricopeptide repeat protein [Thermoflexales bacterium]|nr:tetratricopeptide repeat protein [Thermoflexales bacterium]
MPTSKLGAYCDKIIEMCWLAAVIAAPLFFNVYSSRVFEPDKLTLVRSIAVVASAAWLIKWIEGLGQTPRARPEQAQSLTWRTPLVIPSLILVVCYLISTALSVAPSTSLWGSYQRLQGTYTTFSYIIIFFMILQGLRDKRQLDRLVLTIILNSLPIAFYGLVQRYKLDPLPWGGDVTSRVAANMGNAIFIGAYLIMAFFLTLGRVIESFRSILAEEEAYLSDIARASGYVFIAAVQLITIVFCGSRGPWLGGMVGLFVLGLVLLVDLRRQSPPQGEQSASQQFIRTARKWLWLAWITVALTGAVLLIEFNRPETPLAPLRENPTFGRLGKLFETEGGTGKVRTLIWEGAVQLVWWHEPLRFPGGQSDPYNAVRPLVGYGPESMYVAYNRYYPPDLAHYEARNASPDRSHNETFDALVITGLLGFLAEQLVFISLFVYGFHWLGMMPGLRERKLFIGLWVGLGAAGALVTVLLLKDPKMLGVGVPIGIAGGIVLYLAIYAMFLYDPEQNTTPRSPHQLLMISLLGGIVAHYIEIHFGIAIASTRTTFWTFAGLLVVAGMGWVRQSETAKTMVEEEAPVPAERARSTIPQHKKRRRARQLQAESHPGPSRAWLPVWVGTISGYSMVGAIILSTVLYEFITNSDRLADASQIIWKALTTISMQNGRTSYAVLGLVGLTWLISGLVILAELSRTKVLRKLEEIAGSAAIYYAVSLCVALLFATVLASHLGGLTRTQARTVDEVVQIADQVASILSYYYAFVFLAILVAAGLLVAEERLAGVPLARGIGAVLFIPAMLIALAVLSATNMNPIRADIIYKQADPWDRQGQWDASIAHYKRAIELAPTEDFYYLWLGRAFLEKANAAQNNETHLLSEKTEANAVLKMNVQQTAQLSRQDLLMAARAVLVRAREINPLNTDHSANLARLYRRWADLAETAEDKQARANQSNIYYQDATNLSPNNAVLWNEWATVYLYLKNDSDTALQRLERSLELDPIYNQTYMIMGDLYMNQQKMDEAAGAYEQALKISPSLSQARNVLCYIYAQQNKLDEAIACNLELIKVTPKDWNAYKNMAILFNQKGDLVQALQSAQSARELAPTDQQATLDAYILDIQTRLAQPTPQAAITPTTP